MRDRCKKVIIPLLLALPACEGQEFRMGDSTLEEGRQAFGGGYSAPLVDATALVTGLNASVYKDVASSSTDYYVLTTTGIKKVAHTNPSSLPSAGYIKTIKLDAIDYVDSTWGVVGVRSKVGTTAAQIVLKAQTSAPTTVNLPSTVTNVYDVEARAVSTSIVDVLVKTNGPDPISTSIRRYRYNGSLTSVSSFDQDRWKATGFTMRSSTTDVIGIEYMPGYPVFFRRNTAASAQPYLENQQQQIDNSANPSLGVTSITYSHGYYSNGTPVTLFPAKIDWARFNNGAYHFIMFNAAGADGTYDLVRMDDSNVIWSKTPSRNFSTWNDGSYVMEYNNCYNYATNRLTMNYAQPGFGSGDHYHSLSPADLIQAATNDGLEPVANPGGSAYPSVPEGKTLVAQITGIEVIFPDYHWYRRDRDGKWTHKPGPGAATDQNWNYTGTITDPRIQANWDPAMYDTFVGFYLVDSNYFEGQGWENINGERRRYGPGLDEAGAGAGATALAADAGGLTAMVRVFSGRKNPEARLADPTVVEKVASLFRQTTALPTAAVPPSVPLYKGILVNNPDGLGGMPKTFTIHANLIVAPGIGAPNATYRKDSSGTLEGYLLDQMVGVGGLDSSLRDRIRTLAGK